jgi:hypothetical protein
MPLRNKEVLAKFDLVEGSRMLVLKVAPSLDMVTEYDRCHLLTYARLLEIDRNGAGHYETPEDILDIPLDCDPDLWLECLLSHFDRAHWIFAKGLRSVITTDQQPTQYADYLQLFEAARREWWS